MLNAIYFVSGNALVLMLRISISCAAGMASVPEYVSNNAIRRSNATGYRIAEAEVIM
jgi:hypothetical protein